MLEQVTIWLAFVERNEKDMTATTDFVGWESEGEDFAFENSRSRAAHGISNQNRGEIKGGTVKGAIPGVFELPPKQGIENRHDAFLFDHGDG